MTRTPSHAVASAAASDVGGFPPAAITFLRDLADHNDTAWFDRNRGTYEACVREPAKAFVVALGHALRERGLRRVQAEPAVGRSLFRINRDTRFSADPTPYKPYVDVVVWEGPDPRRSPVFLLRISGTEVTTGAGVLALRDERLTRFRHAVADESSGSELTRALAAVTAAVPGAKITAPTRKRVPSGFPTDHPRAELLKLDGLHAATTEPLPDTSTSRFVDWVADRQVAYAPLHRWLVAHVEETP